MAVYFTFHPPLTPHLTELGRCPCSTLCLGGRLEAGVFPQFVLPRLFPPSTCQAKDAVYDFLRAIEGVGTRNTGAARLWLA